MLQWALLRWRLERPSRRAFGAPQDERAGANDGNRAAMTAIVNVSSPGASTDLIVWRRSM